MKKQKFDQNNLQNTFYAFESYPQKFLLRHSLQKYKNDKNVSCLLAVS